MATSIAFGQTTTTLDTQTKNNTAACAAAGSPSYCQAAMGPMSSSSSATYNLAPGNVSKVDIHSLLYPGNTTQVFAYFEPWFCMNAGSTATGTGSLCTSHIQVGYDSNDSATVHGQMDDIQSRGFNGLVVDSYGPSLNFYDSVSQKIRDDLNARCSGTSCPLSFALMEDDGAFKWTQCPRNGGGVDQTACITQAIENDLDDMNAKYFIAPSYLKVDKVTKQPSADGRPVVFYFFCEECFTNPVPNWGQIWGNVRAHVQPFAHGNGLFIFRNASGFTHTESDGAFAWVNRYGTETSDPVGLVYLDNFYDTSVAGVNSALLTWGAGWKGFDETHAAWNPTPPRSYAQQCGQTWIKTFNEVTHNSNYGSGNQLPFLGVVTWNDYEEGTEIETGIDNCLSSLNPTVSSTALSWSPTFSSADGTESTVSNYIIYDSTDGQNLTSVAKVQSGTHSIDLAPLNLAAGNHMLFVQAVGLPSVQNHISDAIAYTQAPLGSPAVSLSPTALSFSTRLVNTASGSQTVTLMNSGNASLSIFSIATTGDFSQTNACGTALVAGASCSIFVRFTPTRAGTRSGTLSVSDNASGSPHSLSLTGIGTTVQLSATSLVFASQTVGTTSSSRSITVTNKGSVRLRFSSIAITGNFSQTSNCSNSTAGLAPGSSCSISVKFKPSAVGTRTGTLSIYDDGGASPQKVSLTGTGT